MGKIQSAKQVEAARRKAGSKKPQRDLHPFRDDRNLFRLNPLAIPLIFFGFYALFTLIINMEVYAAYRLWCILLVALGALGLAGAFIIQYRAFRTARVELQYGFLNTDLTQSQNIALYMFFILITIFAIQISLIILNITLKYSFGIMDMYFYYLGAAIMEELFFRYFLTSGIYLNINTKGRKIVAPLLSAIPFMLIHWEIYGNSPYLLLAMFIGGFIFGYMYLIHKDISINIIAHCIINFIAATLMYQNLGMTVF